MNPDQTARQARPGHHTRTEHLQPWVRGYVPGLPWPALPASTPASQPARPHLTSSSVRVRGWLQQPAGGRVTTCCSQRRPVSVQGPSFGPSARSPRYLTLGPRGCGGTGWAYGGTRVPGYKVTCLTTACTPCTTQAQTRSPAARSPKPPLPPHLCSKGGSPKTSLCLLVFLGPWLPPGREGGGSTG